MDSQRKKLTTLASELTPQQSSGVAYSLMSVVPVLLSFVFLIVISAAGLVKDGYAETDWYLYCSFLLPQIGSFLIIAFFVKVKQTGFKEICRPVKWQYFLIALILQIGLLSLGELNTWFLELLGEIGYEDDGIRVPNMEGFGFVGVLFTIAVLPAVFEELMCREILLKGLKGYGEVFAVLVSGGLFALYHQNPAQTVYQFCCGAAFALVAIRANSVFPTMLAHFLNNAFVLLAEKFAWDMTAIYLPFLVVSAICLAGSLVYLIFFDKKQGQKEGRSKLKKRDFFLFAAIGILVFGLTWISVLALGI